MNTSSIRIIGGRNKSYRIVFKASPDLRPTSDRAKETLFSWLQFEIENKSCLDLFAGTGALGLEALSRGANHVTFVEKDKVLHLNIIKNINHLGHKNNIEIFHNDAYRWLKTNKKTFDYIFLDPPFDKVKYSDLLSKIYESNIINDGGKVFLETNKHTDIKLNDSQKILKDKIIGDVRLMILQ